MATNFHLAPPAKTVDGLPAVPVDIQTIEAAFVFDGAAQTAVADATISYTVGPGGGNPIFDLRQTITEAWLDGAIFPPSALASHDFGGGAQAGLRVVESVQAAGSVHTLRVRYALGLPAAEAAPGSYQPALEWAAGPRLRLSFGFTDRGAGRYLEAWLPANLIFDQYSIRLELQVVNTPVGHSLITNGQVTSLGANHWLAEFPERFTALSPMLELRATDTLQSLTDTVALPVSGKVVTVEAWKLAGGAANLAARVADIKTFLTENENNYGPYLHENRFVAFFNVGGMEYEGGTTTATSALKHETFHSWFARGVKPASQADGWWDEGFTSWHDSGANDAAPFDFSSGTVTLCSRNPWQRVMATNSYADGEAFFSGLASLLGVGSVNALMRDFYNVYKGRPVTTQMLEEFLLCRGGNDQIVDAFQHFVYGLADSAPAPELWLKDDPAHAGSDEWDGAFWDSPDLWVRNRDDDGTSHQEPERGQDNWFYARVRNKADAGACRHFVVTFHPKAFAGTEFVYPADFLPCTAAKAEFDLNPGETRIVKARWPRALIPPVGSHPCLLAAAIARGDHPSSNRHVWEHNNLAQKNLTVVNLLPDQFIIVPVVLRNFFADVTRYRLEVWRDRAFRDYDVNLIHTSAEFFAPHRKRFFGLCGGGEVFPLEVDAADLNRPEPERLLDCRGHDEAPAPGRPGRLLTSANPDLIARRFSNAFRVPLPPGRTAGIPAILPPSSQQLIGLKVQAPANAKRGAVVKTHFVQRHARTKQITGGVAVEVHVI